MLRGCSENVPRMFREWSENVRVSRVGTKDDNVRAHERGMSTYIYEYIPRMCREWSIAYRFGTKDDETVQFVYILGLFFYW